MIKLGYRFFANFLPIALEGLPISSSSHVLFLASLITRLQQGLFCAALPDDLDHLVHGPIALMVALFFFNRWSFFVRHIGRFWPLFVKIMLLGIITETATGLLYGVWSIIGTEWFPLSVGCAITAVLLFSLYSCPPENSGKWTMGSAVLLGCVQGFALLPGISRLGATYVAARWWGMRPQKAFELSFLIELPISVAGFAKGLLHMHKTHGNLLTMIDITGMAFGFVFGLIGLWYMQKMVTGRRVWQFGWYMACMTIVALFLHA